MKIRSHVPITVYLLYQAELAVLSEELEAAETLCDRAESVVASTDAAGAAEALLTRARVALAAGKHGQASQRAARAAELAHGIGHQRLRDEARLVQAQAELARGEAPLSVLGLLLAEVALGMERRGEHGRIWLAHHLLYEVETLLGRDLEAGFQRQKTARAVDHVLQGLSAPLTQIVMRRRDFRTAYAASRGALPSAAADRPPVAPSFSDAATLLQLNLELGRIRDPEQLLVRLLDQAIELGGAQRGLLILVEGDELRIGAARNVDQETLRRGKEQFSKSLAQQVLATGRTLVSVNAQEDERFTRYESVHVMKLSAVICAPIRSYGSVVGVVYLDNRFQPGAFSERHVALLESFGVQAGLALDTVRLLAEQRQQLRALEQAKAEVEQLSHKLEQSLARQALDLCAARGLVQAQQSELGRDPAFSSIVFRSAAIKRLLQVIGRSASAEIPVYIFGESGTGKELFARAIHRTSPRKDGPLVTLNCGGLSPQLIASELFGHVKGSFTGATRDHVGLIQTASGGTLFLDEVSEMPKELQVQLLRVLQTGDYRPVGSDTERRADVRVISASNQDLETAVAQEAFRLDLYYRLNVLRLDLPPLRKRREDIPLLVQHFLKQRAIDRAALGLLYDYGWPGNVRELENELARAMALGGEVITVDDLSPKLTRATDVRGSDARASLAGTLARRVEACERVSLAAEIRSGTAISAA